jgi:hypothetical protein
MTGILSTNAHDQQNLHSYRLDPVNVPLSYYSANGILSRCKRLQVRLIGDACSVTSASQPRRYKQLNPEPQT